MVGTGDMGIANTTPSTAIVAVLSGYPVAELAALSQRRNPAIPLPRDIFAGRVNSAGVDLADPESDRTGVG